MISIPAGYSAGKQMYNAVMTKGNIVPDRVKKLREDLYDSQDDFVRAWRQRFGSGPHQTHISAVEQGRKGLSLERLVQLAELLETTTDYLLGLTDDPMPKEVELNEALYRLVQAAKELLPYRIADLIAVAEMYRDTQEKNSALRLQDAFLSAIELEAGTENQDRLLDALELLRPFWPSAGQSINTGDDFFRRLPGDGSEEPGGSGDDV